MYEKLKKIVVVVFVFLLFLGVGLFIRKSFSSKNDLINISSLSKEFMDNYFEEVSDSNSDEEKDNMLIVTSIDGIKETYGAVKIIEAPNHQYILQYDSKETKDVALEKFSSEDSNFDVSENAIRRFTEDTVFVSSYDSWGVEAMGIDTLLDKLENRELNDVTVAIIDTGLDLDVFNANYPGRLAGAYNVLENNSNMYDIVGHGTHIAGTIAESTPNNVKILPIKVASWEYAYMTDIIASINYITYNNNADVINMSFGDDYFFNGEYVAIEAAKQKNIISVAAAGNDNLSKAQYPANLDNTISVSAVDSTKVKASFSNYGSSIMFAAPGVDIKSIAIEGDQQVKEGTSMASPHVVGAIANLKSLNKNLSYSDVVTILRRYSEDLGDIGWDEYYGFGFINFTDAQICDGEDCDEYNVFKNRPQDNIEDIVDSYWIDPVLTTYNYGSINNILNTKVNIRYTNDKLVEYHLFDMKNIEISNYDPYSTVKQTISIKFKTSFGEEIEGSFEVTNPDDYESVWEYESVGDNNIELTGYKDPNFIGDTLYIPSEIDGYTVTGIADRNKSIFHSNWESFREVEYLYLPYTLTKIGSHAFEDIGYSQSSLKYVKSDAESISVGDHAFEYCEFLIELDANISYIGDYAFRKDDYLHDIHFSDDITHIGSYAFYNALDDSKITIPSTVIEIGEGAFKSSHLREIIFMNNMEILSASMFEDNSNLYKIVLPNGLKEIGANAFKYCNVLILINLPDGLTTIGNNAFEGAFKRNGNVKITVPRSVSTISEDAFKSIDSTAKLYVYSDSFSKTYAHDNNISYAQIDPDIISVQGINSQYYSFDKIDKSNISLELTYNEKSTRTEAITENIEIEYPDSREDLRYGDILVKVIAYNEMGYRIEKDVEIEVLKLQPDYEVPTGLSANVGQKLSDISLPSNFEWMNSNQSISESGERVFKAKYIPDDIVNYSTVLDIDITLNVSDEIDVPDINNYEIEGNIIKGISLKTSISDLNLGLDDSYTIELKNNNDDNGEYIGTGDEIKIYHNDTLVNSYVVVIKGDINGDGQLKLKDLLTVKNYILKFGDVRNQFDNTSYLFNAADYSDDDRISLKDFGQMKIDFLSH